MSTFWACLTALVASALSAQGSAYYGVRPCEVAEMADDVFAGRVISIREYQTKVPRVLLDSYGIRPLFKVRLAITERFKGIGLQGSEADILSEERDYSSGIPYEMGKSYLIYAKGRDGEFYAGGSWPSGGRLVPYELSSYPIDAASEPLKFLRETAHLPRTHDVSGFVQDAYPVNEGLLLWAPPSAYSLAQWLLPVSWAHAVLRGISLHMDDQNGTRSSALSNGAGQFQFPSVPAGTYHLRVGDANVASALDGDVHVVPGGCRSLFVPLRVADALVGHLKTSAHEPNDGVTLELIADKKDGSRYPEYRATTNSAGNFDFRNVEPGDYRLGVSLTSAASADHPYDRQVSASPIHIVSSPKPLAVDFRTATPRRQGGKLTTVTLLWPDGEPVQYAGLTMADSRGGPVELLDLDPWKGSYRFTAFEGSRYSINAAALSTRYGSMSHIGPIQEDALRLGLVKVVMSQKGPPVF